MRQAIKQLALEEGQTEPGEKLLTSLNTASLSSCHSRAISLRFTRNLIGNKKDMNRRSKLVIKPKGASKMVASRTLACVEGGRRGETPPCGLTWELPFLLKTCMSEGGQEAQHGAMGPAGMQEASCSSHAPTAESKEAGAFPQGRLQHRGVAWVMGRGHTRCAWTPGSPLDRERGIRCKTPSPPAQECNLQTKRPCPSEWGTASRQITFTEISGRASRVASGVGTEEGRKPHLPLRCKTPGQGRSERHGCIAMTAD